MRSTAHRAAQRAAPQAADARAQERAKLAMEIETALRACPRRQLFEVDRLRRRLAELQTVSDSAAPAAPAEQGGSVRRVRKRIASADRGLARVSIRAAKTRKQITSTRSCAEHADTRLARALVMVGLIGSLGTKRLPIDKDSHRNGRTVAMIAPPVPADTAATPAVRDRPPPETRLLVAILDQALNSLRRNQPQKTRRERRLYGEIIDWLGQDDESPFSFAYICMVLNLDPDYLRRGILGSDWRLEIARVQAPGR